MVDPEMDPGSPGDGIPAVRRLPPGNMENASLSPGRSTQARGGHFEPGDGLPWYGDKIQTVREWPPGSESGFPGPGMV